MLECILKMQYKNSKYEYKNTRTSSKFGGFTFAIKHTCTPPCFSVIFMCLLNASSELDIK